jgi:hypothetical protein
MRNSKPKSPRRVFSAIPAQAGIQSSWWFEFFWIPVFTGMTTFCEFVTSENLMVIALIVRAPLRPFTLIVFAANFLANDRISHIEKPEEEAPQMGDASDATSGSLCRKI